MDVYAILVLVALLSLVAVTWIFIQRLNLRYRYILRETGYIKGVVEKLSEQTAFDPDRVSSVIADKLASREGARNEQDYGELIDKLVNEFRSGFENRDADYAELAKKLSEDIGDSLDSREDKSRALIENLIKDIKEDYANRDNQYLSLIDSVTADIKEDYASRQAQFDGVADRITRDVIGELAKRDDSITDGFKESRAAIIEKLEQTRIAMLDTIGDAYACQPYKNAADDADIVNRVDTTLREIQRLAREMKDSVPTYDEMRKDGEIWSIIDGIRADADAAKESLERSQKRLRQLNDCIEDAGGKLRALDRHIKQAKRRQKVEALPAPDDGDDMDMKL